ncbi:hypothetical protein FIBSPDRAFT_914335 [Athelia psychrophila]|uniref:DDE Tnp4 domain-containing protein n=1 Tax=Athelia psychrophila TaxID=1759441 RepID=A0A165X280_9AGAM|nr:hypothetical protein FIBSPDRAFT_914335 [Fibularhizoctonia sp. CBS 109695]
MGRYGNGACLEDIAHQAGHSEGSVENFTSRCFDAIELTPEEKEAEKRWLDQQLGFEGSMWRDGWIMYDGTIVANYGLNAQIGNIPSNLRIVDYSHGMTGSAHDARAFEHTAAALHPDWFFEENEFTWADSAYQVNARTIPVHKKPACLLPENILFDKTVHCMGALKGRFQCLRGLRVKIDSKSDHVAACRWITIAIIIHNIIINVEGGDAVQNFLAAHGAQEELEDHGLPHVPQEGGVVDDDAKRWTLVAEIVAFRKM